MNIVICDDDPLFVKKIKSLIEPIIYFMYPHAKIISFLSGNELLNWYIHSKSTLDILYIDVEMPGFNGIEVLKELRFQKCECFAIFISLYEVYILDTLDYGIVHYLLKPIIPEKLISVTKKVLNKFQLTHKTITIISNDEHVITSIDEIIMIESDYGNLTYHTLNGNYITTGKISKLDEYLSPFHFLRTHKSYLINMDKVISYKKNYFYLIHNNQAEISKNKRSKIIQHFNDYLLNKRLY